MSLLRPRLTTIPPKTISITQCSRFTTSKHFESVSDRLRTEAHRNNQKFKLENIFNVEDKGIAMQFLCQIYTE